MKRQGAMARPTNSSIGLLASTSAVGSRLSASARITEPSVMGARDVRTIRC